MKKEKNKHAVMLGRLRAEQIREEQGKSFYRDAVKKRKWRPVKQSVDNPS